MSQGRTLEEAQVQSQPGDTGEGVKIVSMRLDCFDFGFGPEIDVSYLSQVFDGTALAQEELGISNGESAK